ncbi:PIN-like domain-containing protein [Micromonospora sp. CPCC 205539]|uniref:PIN-like domain-containing protein n=1 Tax=Micromonospora sp. CPCC 205539 TaxID=3122408 RepID=UPI002FF33DC4
MSEDKPEGLLLTRYESWLTPQQMSPPGSVAKKFFEDAAVILDANVLLDLYRYTKAGREQVLSALELFAKRQRLWLPYQVGIEFSRNRASAVQGRLAQLSATGKNVSTKFQAASRLIRESREEVANLIREMTQDEDAADEVVELVADADIDDVMKDWQKHLLEKLRRLKSEEAVSPQHVGGNDPLLPQIAGLFAGAVGAPLAQGATRALVEIAINYRYPNKIPPGFADGQKDTDLRAAGDYIIWEEMISFATSLAKPRSLIFVSGDTKGDWYELDNNGKPLRPWPALHEEMRSRAAAELLILTPKEFLRGAHEVLGAPLETKTYDEVERISEGAAVPDTDSWQGHAAATQLSRLSSSSMAGGSAENADAAVLELRLARILAERDGLRISLEQRPGESGNNDPRSFARIVASRIDELSAQAAALRQRLEVLGTQNSLMA